MSNDPYRQTDAIERNTDEELARAAVTRALLHDEQVIWAGRPKQGVYLTRADFFAIPLSLFWGGGALLSEFLAVSRGELFGSLFGVPFVLMGLYMMLGRFLVDARARARIFYAVTNRRVLVVTHLFMRNLTTVDLIETVQVSLEERSDGSGTISLGRPSDLRRGMDALVGASLMTDELGTAALRNIAGARQVFNAIRDAQESQRAKYSGEQSE